MFLTKISKLERDNNIIILFSFIFSGFGDSVTGTKSQNNEHCDHSCQLPCTPWKLIDVCLLEY